MFLVSHELSVNMADVAEVVRLRMLLGHLGYLGQRDPFLFAKSVLIFAPWLVFTFPCRGAPRMNHLLVLGLGFPHTLLRSF